MKRLYTKLFCTLLLLLTTAIQANAQCDDVTLSIESSEPSLCSASGKVVAKLEGTDVASLLNIRYSLDPDPAETDPDRTTIGSQNSNILMDIAKGKYIVTMEAVCTTNGGRITRTCSVTVGGNYQKPQAELNQNASRSSYPCGTGTIVLNVNYGRGDYTFEITAAPAGVTQGPVTATKNYSTYTLTGTNYPAGAYSVKISDECNSFVTCNFTIREITDVPNASTLFHPLYQNIDSSDKILVSVPTRSNLTTNSDWLRHYDDGLYQIGLAPEGQTPTTWYDWNAGTLTNGFLLASMPESTNYKDFFTDKKMSTHIRIKDCNYSKVSSTSFLPKPSISSSNVAALAECDASYRRVYWNKQSLLKYPVTVTVSENGGSEIHRHIYTTFPSAFEDIRHNIDKAYTATVTDASGYSTNYAINPSTEVASLTMNPIPACENYQIYLTMFRPCFPARMVVTETATNTEVYTAPVTAINVRNYITLEYGKAYSVTLWYNNDADKLTWTRTAVTSTMPRSVSMTFTNTCSSIKDYGNIDIKWNGTILAGTTMEITDGPAGYNKEDQEVYFPNNSLSSASFAKTALPPGTYKVKVTPPCGEPFTAEATHAGGYNVRDLGYTATASCEGIKVTPSGYVTLGRVDQPAITKYKIVRGVSGYPTNIISYGESFTLSPGTYTMAIQANTTCQLETLEFTVESSNIELDNSKTMSYGCNQGDGVIIISARKGVPPYKYELWDAAGTTRLLGPEEKGAGERMVFRYGRAGDVYLVKVSDCTGGFQQQVSIQELTETNIATAAPPNICAGEAINLTCTSLGIATYEWMNPQGVVFSTERSPVIANATPEMSGIYTVRVTPEFCGNTVTGTVNIKVYGAPILGAVSPRQEICAGAVPAPLSCTIDPASILGIPAYQWQTSSDGTTWTDIENATQERYTPAAQTALGIYYYRLKITGCSYTTNSDRMEIEVRGCYAPVNPHLRSTGKKSN